MGVPAEQGSSMSGGVGSYTVWRMCLRSSVCSTTRKQVVLLAAQGVAQRLVALHGNRCGSCSLSWHPCLADIRPARPEGHSPELTVMVLWNGVVHPHRSRDAAAFGERTRRGKTLLILSDVA